MCVPAHDDRDYEFAKKFNIPIIQVISKNGKATSDGRIPMDGITPDDGNVLPENEGAYIELILVI